MAKQKAKASKQPQGLTKKQLKRRERKQKKRRAEAEVQDNLPAKPLGNDDEEVVAPRTGIKADGAEELVALERMSKGSEKKGKSVEVNEKVPMTNAASLVKETDIRNSLVGQLAEALLSQQLEEENRSRGAKKRAQQLEEGTKMGGPIKKRAKLEANARSTPESSRRRKEKKEKKKSEKKENGKKKDKESRSPAGKMSPLGGGQMRSAEQPKASLLPKIKYEASSAHVILPRGQSLMIDGMTAVMLLSGSASILGYKLRPETETLVSSSGLLAPVPLVVCERGHGSRETRQQEGNETLEDQVEGPGQESEARLLFRSCWPKKGEGQKEGPRTFRLEAKAAASAQRAQPNGSVTEPSPSKSKRLEVKLQPMLIPFSWKTVTDSVVGKRGAPDAPLSPLANERTASHAAGFSGRPPIVAVCGGKNVGKSTYARYLVNRLLCQYSSVAYLETDVGQPEFTVPGLLSLHLLTEPVFGPPNLHLRDPETTLFYGDVSAKADPHLFLRCVVALYDRFRTKHYDGHPPGEQLPLVINTHGWIKGLGLDVLIDVLRYTVPTHVVDVQSSKASKNLPPGNFWETTPEPISRIHYIPTAVAAEPDANSPFGHKFAPEERALRLLAHFQRVADSTAPPAFPFNERGAYLSLATCLAHKRPYQVRFDAVRIRHLHGHVPIGEALWALNGAVVGLAREAEEDLTGPLPICLDVGLVRGIDPKKSVLFLVTCLPLAQLQKVNTLVQGKLDLPLQLLSAPPYVSPYLSFTSITAEGTGSATIRSRNNLVRKSGE